MMLRDELKDLKDKVLFELLEKNKKNCEESKLLLEEINERIKSGNLVFNLKNIDSLYIYMFSCNKYEITEELNKLIEDKNFINLIDKSNIEGSMIPSLTMNCKHPRKNLLTNSIKIKKSILEDDKILSVTDILEDLSQEEIKILRDDLDIDNFLISKGLCFNTLKEETIDQLLENIENFSIYNIKTISEFTNNFSNIKQLANNKEFIKIYLNKLDDDYSYSNNIFKFFNIKEINNIIDSNPKECVLFHLVKDTKENIQREIINNKKIRQLLYNTQNQYILKTIPSNIIVDIILNKNLTYKDLSFLNYLNSKEINHVFKKKKELYDIFVENINNCVFDDIELIVTSLPQDLYKDLSQVKILDFNIDKLSDLLRINNQVFKKILFGNNKLINQIVNEIKENDYKKIISLFKTGNFNVEEQITFINQISDYHNQSTIVRLVENIPVNYRNHFIKNKNIRNILLSENDYSTDEYLIKYLLNHLDEMKITSPRMIIELLKVADNKIAEKIINDSYLIKKIIKTKDNNLLTDLINISKSNNLLKNLINNNDIYNSYFITILLPYLNIDEKLSLCDENFLKRILSDSSYNTYLKLLNRNHYILNTINFNFLEDNSKQIKLSILEALTKYPDIQDYLVRINRYFNVTALINFIFYDLANLGNEVITKCLSLLCDSCEGKNRKYIGNIPRMIESISHEIKREDYINIFNYLLYFIPHYQSNKSSVKKELYIETANTYEDIQNYELNTENKLTNLIQDNNDIKEYFIYKHFKLSLEEAKCFINTYSIKNIDKKIYQEEYSYIESLINIIDSDSNNLKSLDKSFKTYSIYQTYEIENNIRKMYSKIFNYEIKSKVYVSKSFEDNEFCKNLTIYNCPNEFLFLISRVDLTKELEKTNSYFKAWHNTLNGLQNGIKMTLISNENLNFKEDFLFGFDGVSENGILKMSNIDNSINDYKEKFMTPKELINNTRDIANTVIIDRFAVRPNYNNSNIPNIEPDFLLIDKSKLDNLSYVQKVTSISEEFKTKRHKNGLPLLVVDIQKVISNEKSKIDNLIRKYQKNHDNKILENILTRIENNYNTYQDRPLWQENFDIDPVIELLVNRINSTKSLKELNLLEEIFTNEYNKFSEIDIVNCNFNIKEIQKLIDSKKEIINNS